MAMKRKYDPRAPRLNPEIEVFRRVFTNRLREFKMSESYTEMVGNAVITRAVIEQFLEEPEFIYDIAEIPPEKKRELLFPEDGDAGVGLEDPFAEPGYSEGRFFYYNYSSRITPLFRKEQASLYDPWKLSVYWVRVLEKRYASSAETRMRFTSEEALRRCIPRPRPLDRRERGVYLLMCDPLGYYDGKSAKIAAEYVSLSRAVKAADRLSEWLDIRFLVAAWRDTIHTH